MILPTTFLAAMLLLAVSVLCWGSWMNTLKLSGNWRFELYYIDFALGLALCSLIAAFTFGSANSQDLTFTDNLLLTGYRQPPAGFEVAQGMHYNAAFPGHQIAMPPPLSDGVVAYTDGTKPTLDNYAKDVSAYLMWAAEPKLEERHKTGARVMIFLIVFVVIMYLAKRRVWARLHHRDATHTA